MMMISFTIALAAAALCNDSASEDAVISRVIPRGNFIFRPFFYESSARESATVVMTTAVFADLFLISAAEGEVVL